MCKKAIVRNAVENQNKLKEEKKEIEEKKNNLTSSTSVFETIRTPSLLTKRSPSLNVPEPVLHKLKEIQMNWNAKKEIEGKRSSVVQEFRDVIRRWDGELEIWS